MLPAVEARRRRWVGPQAQAAAKRAGSSPRRARSPVAPAQPAVLRPMSLARSERWRRLVRRPWMVPRLAAQRLTAEPMRLAQATQPPAGPAAGAGAAPASQRIELAVLLTGRPMQVGFRGWAPRSVAAAAARPQPAPGSAAQPAMPVAPAHWRILPTAHWPPRSAFPR